MSEEFLAHHGIKDQKWYRRRFQNEDGSLTPAGRERYGEWHPGKRKPTKLTVSKENGGQKKYNIESEDGEAVGSITTTHQSDDALRVNWINVDKEHKREGYGTSAMDTLIEDAKKNGYKKVTVVIPTDSKDVQHMYERMGFNVSKEGLTIDEVADSITTLGNVVKLEYDLEHSDIDGKEVKVYELNKVSEELDHWVDNLLDEVKHIDEGGDYLEHYGVGPDDNPPGRGSGRYAKGTGERPFQHDPAMQDAFNRRRKKWGIFERIKQRKEKAATEHAEAAKKREEERQIKEAQVKAEAAKKKRLEALAKAREVRKANIDKAAAEKAAEEARQKRIKEAIDSGDPTRIAAIMSQLSNQEQKDAITRINQTAEISKLAAEQRKAIADAEAARLAAQKAIEEANRPRTKAEIREQKFNEAMEKVSKAADKVDKIRVNGEKFIKFYNLAAAVNNSLNDKMKLPKIDLGGGQKNDKDKDEQKNKDKDKDKDKQQQKNNAGNTYNQYNYYGNSSTDSSEKSTQNSKTVDAEFREVKSEPSSSTSSTQSYASYGEKIYEALPAQSSYDQSKAAEAGMKYYMTVVNGGGSYFGSSSESSANYNRNRSTENASYNAWERDQAQKAADRARREAQNAAKKAEEAERGRKEAEALSRKFAAERAARREEQEREANRRERDQEIERLARKLRMARETVEDARSNSRSRSLFDAGHKTTSSSSWDKMAEAAAEDISSVYDEARQKGLDIDEILKRAR